MKRISLIVLLLVACSASATETQNYSVKNDHLGQCLVQVAVPVKWNGNLLVIAHGRRADDQPLSANFSTADVFPGKLLEEGWLVACTSYRRNGWIVDDAIADIHDLLTYVESEYGKPQHTYMVGSSMGGMIATKIAEAEKDRYDGILVIGAALWLDAPDPHEKLNFTPQTPILFISNRDELNDPQNYIAHITKGSVQPVLWHIDRDGHCNLTADERLASFQALVSYHDTGRIAKDKDATIVPPTPKSTAVFRDGNAFAAVTECEYGILTKFVAADLEKMGINKGSYFIVRFRDKSAKVLLGKRGAYDVPRGEWIAFMTAEGFLKIARNYASAVEVLGCKAKDTISIEPSAIVQNAK